MKFTAIKNFLHDGNHVEGGTVMELNSDDAKLLLGLGCVEPSTEAPPAEEVKKPKAK